MSYLKNGLIMHPSISLEVPSPVRLLDRVGERVRVKHYSIRTEQAYVDWIKRYILFHGKQHPRDLGKQKGVYHINAVDEVTQFEVVCSVEKISERY